MTEGITQWKVDILLKQASKTIPKDLDVFTEKNLNEAEKQILFLDSMYYFLMVYIVKV